MPPEEAKEEQHARESEGRNNVPTKIEVDVKWAVGAIVALGVLTSLAIGAIMASLQFNRTVAEIRLHEERGDRKLQRFFDDIGDMNLHYQDQTTRAYQDRTQAVDELSRELGRLRQTLENPEHPRFHPPASNGRCHGRCRTSSGSCVVSTHVGPALPPYQVRSLVRLRRELETLNRRLAAFGTPKPPADPPDPEGALDKSPTEEAEPEPPADPPDPEGALDKSPTEEAEPEPPAEEQQEPPAVS